MRSTIVFICHFDVSVKITELQPVEAVQSNLTPCGGQTVQLNCARLTSRDSPIHWLSLVTRCVYTGRFK